MKHPLFTLLFTAQISGFALAQDEIYDSIEDRTDGLVTLPEGAEVEPKAPEEKLGRSISSSELITVYGKSVTLRNTIAAVGDEMIRELSDLLGEKDLKGYESKLTIKLHGKLGDEFKGSPYRKRFGLRKEGGHYLLLHIHLGDKIVIEDMKREMMQMLIIERTLRGKTSLDEDEELTVFPFLVDGLIEATQWANKRGNRDDYKDLQKNPNQYSLPRVLSTSHSDVVKMNITTRGSYNVACSTLIMALISDREGEAGMIEVLSTAALFKAEPDELLKQNFSKTAENPKSLQKWWMIQLAKMSANRLSDVMSMLETEKRLDDITVFKYVKDKKEVFIQLDDVEAIDELTDEEFNSGLIQGVAQLRQLSHRCFPEYKPLIQGYMSVYSLYRAKKEKDKKGIPLILERLAEERVNMSAAAIASRDYLDWFVINASEKLSGNYYGFNKVLSDNTKNKQRVRSSIFSDYIDRVQAFHDSEVAVEILLVSV